jgi:AIPR protein
VATRARTPTDIRLRELREELKELGSRFRGVSENDLFVLWFLLAYLVDEEDIAARGLVGGSGDKSVDAVVIDDRANTVFLVQGKFRLNINQKPEQRSDVVAFADLGAVLWGDRDNYKRFTDGLDPLVRDRLDEARNRVQRRDRWKAHLFYATTGSCSKSLETEAKNIARNAKGPTEFDVLDGRAVLGVYRDYIDGVAPPVRSLDFPVQATGRLQSGVSNRFDPSSQIESWVFTMSGREVANLFAATGVRLFARNIRGFLGGKTGVNEAMQVTLSERPEYFWYFNNGITVVCSDAEEIRKRAKIVLRVTNPQVINGQQTTRVLAAQDDIAPTATVLARVIRIPRDAQGEDRFEELVSRIVEATNYQNQIKASDLVANDRTQVFIEREFRKLGYQYLRKRQTNAEARAAGGSRFRFLVRKEELAQAAAACIFDPYIVRQGKEGLFAEQYYTTVFDGTTAAYYLNRLWLLRRVGLASSGYPERAYAKWVVLHFMWAKIGREISSRSDGFRAACEQPRRNEAFLQPLHKAIEVAFLECLAFYRQNRGSGPTAVDVSAFFNRRNRHKEFEAYWDQSGSVPRKKRFDAALARFAKHLKES